VAEGGGLLMRERPSRRVLVSPFTQAFLRPQASPPPSLSRSVPARNCPLGANSGAKVWDGMISFASELFRSILTLGRTNRRSGRSCVSKKPLGGDRCKPARRR
jgi:hypothetical protein